MALIGPKNPGSFLSVDFGTAGTSWSNPSNIAASDGVFATATFTSNRGSTGSNTQYIVSYNYGFDVPLTATINGILAEFERYTASTVRSPRDRAVILTRNGTVDLTSIVTEDKATLTTWPTAKAYTSYGGPSDLWTATWTPSDINSSGFGFFTGCTRNTGKGSSQVFIDHMRMTVYYTGIGGEMSSSTKYSQFITFF